MYYFRSYFSQGYSCQKERSAVRKRTKLKTRNIFNEFLAQNEVFTRFLLLSVGEQACVEALDENYACWCTKKCPIIEE
jgi:hypothetical protein